MSKLIKSDTSGVTVSWASNLPLLLDVFCCPIESFKARPNPRVHSQTQTRLTAVANCINNPDETIILIGILASAIISPKQLKRARSALGITQAKLAREAGVSQSLIAKIEAGKVDPTYSSMRSISEALRARRSVEGKKAADVMSSPVIYLEADAKLLDCVTVMKNHDISQIPILAGNRVVGSITEANLLELLSEADNPSSLLSRPVKPFMQPPFPIVSADTPIEALVSLFNHVPAVAVSTADKIIGLISKIDLIAAEAETEA